LSHPAAWRTALGLGARATDNTNYLPLAGGTVTGTLVLSRTQDAAGTADQKPALIIGGASTAEHIEIDSNEILAKSNGTTPATLILQDTTGIVYVGGSGGLRVPNGRFHVGPRVNWNSGEAGCWIGVDGTMHLSHASDGGSLYFHF